MTGTTVFAWLGGILAVILFLIVELFSIRSASADSVFIGISNSPGMFHTYHHNGAYKPWYNRGPSFRISVNSGGQFSSNYQGGGVRFPRRFTPHMDAKKHRREPRNQQRNAWVHSTALSTAQRTEGGWTYTVR